MRSPDVSAMAQRRILVLGVPLTIVRTVGLPSYRISTVRFLSPNERAQLRNDKLEKQANGPVVCLSIRNMHVERE